MKKIVLLALGVSVLLSGCGGFLAAPTLTPTLAPTETPTPLPPTATATVTLTATITPTFTPQPTPTTTRVYQGPGHVMIPILLYHHIQSTISFSRYRVPPEEFDRQMQLLHNWGYETITTEQLVKAITEGASLPPRPILITFDDGDVDIYQYAFPIMAKYGFKGVFYLVANYVNQPNYIGVAQVKEMAAAGWEIGSHSLNHIDLTLSPDRVRAEVVESKQLLEDMLGVPILTFAYPFGKSAGGAVDYVHFAKYIAAMGLGFTADQWESNLFYLQRWEVQNGFDMKAFTSFLPWQGDPALIPPDVAISTATLVPSATPTATRTP